MILNVSDTMQICDWLISRGLGLGEAAEVIANVECGDSLSLALLKVFMERKITMEKRGDKILNPDWSNPLTP